MAPQLPPDAAVGGGILTVVAVDKDKHSASAVKWAVDCLLVNNNITLILVHVRTKSSAHHNSSPDANGGASDQDSQSVFTPFRAYSARKGLIVKEVIVEDSDVSKALVEYINKYRISNIVLGASTRSAIARKFWTHDVPTIINKTAPDFCSVYVISKGKQQSFRPAARPLACAPSQAQFTPPHTRPPFRNTSAELEDVRHSSHMRGEQNTRPKKGLGTDSFDAPIRRAKNSSTRNSLSDNESEVLASFRQGSLDLTVQNIDFTRVSDGSNDGNSASKDLEAEMKRLKLELKQTMDMYNTACKEAVSAKQMAKQLQQSKMEEARRFEQVKLSEEAALAMVEMEKAKCKAAIEAAEKAQKLAEMEAQRVKIAEMKSKKDAHEKNQALNSLSHDARYRKYAIEEIEAATDKFSQAKKIGEGGYGPVFKGKLDHTPVAIKVLRPDAAQGRKQFQQEVEILSLIRHPNMVLLLGACPQYGCLVYEYMNYGSLEDRLFRKGNTPPIPWGIRFKIAADIATGLLFLHQSKPEPLVHRDLKPANILLDRHYVCKISDVGLARLVPQSVADSVTQYHMTSAAGTFCYIDPEYQQSGRLGTKSDIYSLGVMLLQIITARPPMGLTHQVEKAIEKGTFAELLDPTVQDWPMEETLNFAKLSLRCAELRKRDRPELSSVVLPELNRLKELGMESMQKKYWS
ncbi:PREDICTED: U-box domain-containing protein 35-like [Ipomoea nil]|uniref:U-box domain-containing protein 35-like n=1 Tax=Ipomoea nil TaxID=35883 RepID=UPI000901C49A|nr:PREDICTED: U-box domain-containing protein 35-like [Ipomoea nil]XP_019161919.1 PREDICTED: U-box domain-containing protein 35-like [Ipomoea nil]